jgi:hypothetical protein
MRNQKRKEEKKGNRDTALNFYMSYSHRNKIPLTRGRIKGREEERKRRSEEREEQRRREEERGAVRKRRRRKRGREGRRRV